MPSARVKKILLAGLAIAILAGLAAGALSLRARRAEALQNVPAPAHYPWALRTARVEKRDLTEGFPILATVSSLAEVVIIPQISGVIRKMGPREGKPVRKGDLLALLDTREIESQQAALQARYQSAQDQVTLRKTELQRREALLLKGYVSQESIDQERTSLRTEIQSVKQLRDEIKALATRIKYGTIRSPVDGVLSERLQEPGDLAAPGKPIYRITASDGAKLRITVPQAVAAQLLKGSEIEISHGGQNRTIRLTRIIPALDALSMGSAEADLDHIPFALPSGARVPGRVILKRWPEAKLVPRTTLILAPGGKQASVFKIIAAKPGQPGRLRKFKVSIIASGREGVAIAGDLAAGDQVALAQENQLLKLKDGDPVLPEPVRR